MQYDEATLETTKQMKANSNESPVNTANIVPDGANNVDIDLTSDAAEKDYPSSDDKDSDDGVEFVGSIDPSAQIKSNIGTNGEMHSPDKEKDITGTPMIDNTHTNDFVSTPKDENASKHDLDDASQTAAEPEKVEDQTIEENDDQSVIQRDDQVSVTNMRKGNTVSLLLEAAKNSDEKQMEKNSINGLDAMQILAEATEGRSTSKDSDDDEFSDVNAAKLFASIRNIPVDSEAIEDLQKATLKPSAEPEVEPKDPADAMLLRLPELPSEPKYILSDSDRRNSAEDSTQSVPLDVKEPVFIVNEEEPKEEPLYYSSIDTWFPSNNAIKREKKKTKADVTAYEMKLRSGEKIKVTSAMHNRLGKNDEPGVVDKLPHCKIHERMFQAQYGKLSKEPLFCCQVTEIYCTSVMLCCSVCSTWRHAECGGHYTYYSPKKCEANFTPVCDRCYKEKQLLQKYPQAEKRISRQRSIHLRKTHVAADIMRHAAYAKHGGTYKWPLGSVVQSNIGGHSRSVHIRHERSEKQWKEMLHKLNAATAGKRERVKQRTKELERVLNNLEEAGKSSTIFETFHK